MALTNIDYKVTFDITNSQFILDDLTGYATASPVVTDASGALTITDPLNNTFNINLSDADVTAQGTASAVASMSGGNFVPGLYQFSYVVTSPATAGFPVTKDISYTYGYTSPVVDLGITYDPAIPQLVSTDATDYVYASITPTTVLSHDLLYPPTTAGPDINTATAAITTSVVYVQSGVPLQYSSTITSTLTYAISTNICILDSVTGSAYSDIVDGADLCAVYCCLKSTWTAYNNAKCNNLATSEAILETFVHMTALANQIDRAIRCGKTDDINAYKQELMQIGDCSSDCDCSDGAPVLVTGLGGGGGGTADGNDIAIVVQGTSINVASATAGSTITYTVSVAGALLTTISTNTTNIGLNTTAIGLNTTAIGLLSTPDILKFFVEFTNITAIRNTVTSPTIGITQVVANGNYFDGTPTASTIITGGIFWSANFRFKILVNSTNITVLDYPKVVVAKLSAQYNAAYILANAPTYDNSYDHDIHVLCDVQIDELSPGAIYVTPKREVGGQYQTVSAGSFFENVESLKLSVIIEK